MVFGRVAVRARSRASAVAGLAALAFLVLAPLLWWNLKKYQHDHFVFGPPQTTLKTGPGSVEDAEPAVVAHRQPYDALQQRAALRSAALAELRNWFLTMLTLGLYWPFATVAMNANAARSDERDGASRPARPRR
jgi:hypothetical protein